MVSRRHAGFALLWVGITLVLNALIVPLSVSGLEAVPVWQILASRSLRVAWGAGLGVLSTLCVCGCLWADVLREGPELGHLLGRIEQEQARREVAEAQLGALRAEAERAGSARTLPFSREGMGASCRRRLWYPAKRSARFWTVALLYTLCREIYASQGSPG